LEDISGISHHTWGKDFGGASELGLGVLELVLLACGVGDLLSVCMKTSQRSNSGSEVSKRNVITLKRVAEVTRGAQVRAIFFGKRLVVVQLGPLQAIWTFLVVLFPDWNLHILYFCSCS
jgi:hypothetical protein